MRATSFTWPRCTGPRVWSSTVIVVAPESYLGPAEETAGKRRLLYVALTRAKRGALLLQV